MRSDDVCLIIALDVKLLLSWFDVLLCANHTQIHRDYWHRGKSWKRGLGCTAAAVRLLYTDFVIAHTPRTHTWYIQERTNIHIHTESRPVTIAKKR